MTRSAARWFLFLMTAFCLQSFSELPAAGKADIAWMKQRMAQRMSRQKLRDEAEKDRVKRTEYAARTLEEILTAHPTAPADPGLKAELLGLIDGLAMLDAQAAAPLREKAAALPVAGTDSESPTAAEIDKKWKIALSSAQQKLTRRPLDLLRKSIDLGMVDLSFGFLREVLTFDPDSKPVRSEMKQTKIEDDWISPYMLGRLKGGQSWDEKLGWVLTKNKDRYEAGKIYDFQVKKWLPLEEANQSHGELGKGWVFTTEHLEIRGNADMAVLAEAATRLEQFYQQIFATYALFFAKGQSADYQLILGMAQHKPLIVNIYRDKAQYQKALPQAPSWSAGLYGGGQSHFYGRVGGVMYHEFTHHILDVFTGGNRSPAWLTEGIASYTQDVDYDAMGRLMLGSKPRKSPYPLEELLALQSGTQWVQNPQYAAAASLIWFCMEGESRKFREDFIDFLRDNYRGQTRDYTLWEYLGISEEEFKGLYRKHQG